MLAKIYDRLVFRLTPRDPVEAAVRIEQLRATARANQNFVANGAIAIILALIDLQWASPQRILPWLLSTLISLLWMTVGSKRLLSRAPVAADAGRFTLRMLLVCLPSLTLWPTMVLYVWNPGDVLNQAYLTIFLLASMSIAAPQTGYCRYVAWPGLAAYFPLLACYHVGGTLLFNIAGPVLQTLCGLMVLKLSLRFEHAFTEQALRSIETQRLASELQRTAEELAQARDCAQEASELKSKFLANMSHELRTPLNAIIGFSDIIRNRILGPIAPPKYGEYADDIHRSGMHLLNLINNLLDLAKIEAGKQELQDSELDLEQIAASAFRFVEVQARKGGVSLLTEIVPASGLLADERSVIQIITNLVSNSVKFTAPGGDVTVFSHALADGGLALGVKDTGLGMEPEDVQRALEPFVQVAHRATVDGWGAGLGLPLVKGLVELQGGSFHIESHRGIGTCAWAEFPPMRSLRHRKDRAA